MFVQEYANIDAQVKHLGQKYMGIRPSSHADEMFRETPFNTGGHIVPVSNFLNAQCKLQLFDAKWLN
jgi:saccharopepsin